MSDIYASVHPHNNFSDENSSFGSDLSISSQYSNIHSLIDVVIHS